MRKRIFLAIGGTLLVMLIIISVASNALLNRSYAGLERRYITRDVQRVTSDIARQQTGMGQSVGDTATWTAMYDFVERPSAAFAQGAFSEQDAENMRVNVIVIVDDQGRVVLHEAFGAAAKSGLLESTVAWIAAHPSFVRFADREGKGQEIMTLPQGVLMAVSRPIQDDMRTLPVRGALVMGRLLDAEYVRQMGSRLLVTLALYPLNGTPLPDSVARALPRLSEANPLFLDTNLASTVSGYTLLRDGRHTAVAIVRVDSTRDIQAQGILSVRYFFFFLLFVGVAFCGVVIFTIDRTILSRLLLLGKSVLAIGTGGDPTRRVAISGKDQIAYIGAAINGMLDAQARATEQLRASERRNEAFLDAVPDAIFRVTRDGTILDARSPRRLPLLETANNLVGKDAETILPFYSFLSPELFDKSIAATEAALATGTPQMLAFHVDAESGRRHYEERFVASGEDEVIVLVREVTDQKSAEESRRREVLLKEIHHRVKNNLQVISSLLSLQAGASGDPRTRALLQESRNRVHSMALIHEKLYQSTDERGVSFSAYVRDLVVHLRHSYEGNSQTVAIELDIDDIALDMDVLVPCGLIINELLSNALKYAFPNGRKGTLHVRLHRAKPDSLALSISDDGVGLPEGLDIRAPATLGLRIVNSLVAQLKGTLTQGPAPGASFTVTFPVR